MPAPVTLSIALSDNERTRPIVEGRHAPQGVALACTVVHPSEMFWRQLKFAEFDVSEMSLSSLFIAMSKGDRRFLAIPVYTARMFFHTRIFVRRDSGIEHPRDLVGKRIGVPEYQQTSAIWSRGVLQHEFGVHPRDIQWFMERTPDMSHGGSTGFAPPPGVRINQIPMSSNIGQMLLDGELDGTLLYLSERNLVDRSSADISQVCRPLFPDRRAESVRYFDKTGIYPINHTLVIKRETHERYPWAAVNMFHAFMAAKAEVEATTRETLKHYAACGFLDLDADALLSHDPKAYGLRKTRPVIETIARYVHEQGLTDRVMPVDELFAPATLDL